MFRSALRLLTFIVVYGVAAGAASAYSLKSDEGRFSVELPGEPAFEKLHEKTKAGYFVDRYQWLLDLGDTAWIVTYGDYPQSDVQRLGAEAMYDNGAKGSVEGVNGQLRSQQPVVNGGVRGRELFVFVPDSNLAMRQRMFIVGTRLYQNVYVGADGTERDAKVEAFLNSFQMRK